MGWPFGEDKQLGDAPKGSKHRVRLVGNKGERDEGRRSTMTVIAPSRERAEDIARKSWPNKTVQAHVPASQPNAYGPTVGAGTSPSSD